MPKYDAECKICGSFSEYIRSVEEHHDTPECCGTKMQQVILAAPTGFVMGRFEPFVSPVDKSVITTRRDLEEHNKRNNIVSMADGYSDATIKAGEFGKATAPSKLSKKELMHDVAEATLMVRDGYKPKLEVLDDD